MVIIITIAVIINNIKTNNNTNNKTNINNNVLLFQMMPKYADFMFNIGVLDEPERDYFQKETDLAVAKIKAGDYLAAFKVNRIVHTCSSQKVVVTQEESISCHDNQA